MPHSAIKSAETCARPNSLCMQISKIPASLTFPVLKSPSSFIIFGGNFFVAFMKKSHPNGNLKSLLSVSASFSRSHCFASMAESVQTKTRFTSHSRKTANFSLCLVLRDQSRLSSCSHESWRQIFLQQLCTSISETGARTHTLLHTYKYNTNAQARTVRIHLRRFLASALIFGPCL
jgi:hypothetical protein